jgi:hypothetical protein
MFAFRGLALYWLDCQYPSVLILRLNANIYVWMFGHLDAEAATADASVSGQEIPVFSFF